MKFSRAFIPTLRQAPNDAEVVSHKLLSRAGMIRKVAMGIYDFLPLGLSSLTKIANIVREEMNRAGAIEIAMPHLVPAELWQESGRWQKYGKELLRIQDRHERDYCFGPTHEEVVCDMVRGSLKSYRDYPVNLYQIQTKFRDEIRPRFGLMRGREFLMKDAYSFHATDDDLDREYRAMHAAYLKVFERCGLACRAVQADTGAIGGSVSHEFMVLADTGEDTVASCGSCDYAANLEKARRRPPSEPGETVPESRDVLTPDLKSAQEVSAFLKIPAARLVKTLVLKADDLYVAACLPGDRDLNEIKLKNYLNADGLRLATDGEIVELTGVPPGFLGPVGLSERIAAARPGAKFKIIFDESLKAGLKYATGANKKDHHKVDVDLGRDAGLKESANLSVADIANVATGDTCPACDKGKLQLMRGIEVGHIFKLGRKYSEPMKVTFLDAEGGERVVTMGCYGIGVSRVLAACVEQHHDDHGISWPKALAPFDCHLLTMGPESPLKDAAEKIYAALNEAGLPALYDDRDERAGVKFNDADLIGVPLQIVIGKRGLEKGEVEYKIRRTGEKGSLPLEGLVAKVRELRERLP